MTEIQILTKQTSEAYAWVNRLLDSIDIKDWETMSNGLETHVMWQAGHLTMSHYFHVSMQLVGHSESILKSVPLKLYGKLFSNADPKESLGKAKPEEVKIHLILVQKITLDILSNLSDTDLDSPVIPTDFEHPFAKTKRQAINWNAQHAMWHCGQLGLLIRKLGERFDFTR